MVIASIALSFFVSDAIRAKWREKRGEQKSDEAADVGRKSLVGWIEGGSFY